LKSLISSSKRIWKKNWRYKKAKTADLENNSRKLKSGLKA